LLLVVLLALSVAFASLTVSEYHQVGALNSRIQSQAQSTSTLTLSTTTVTTTITCPANMLCASFRYIPTSPLHVESVEANETDDGAAVFWVTVEDGAASPISFDNFDLNFSVPSNSSVLKEVQTPGFTGGSDVTVTTTLNQGDSYTLQGLYPNTKSLYYKVAEPGTVNMTFTFTWGDEAIPEYTTMIWAQFVFP
jgi:hypothetical protein